MCYACWLVYLVGAKEIQLFIACIVTIMLSCSHYKIQIVTSTKYDFYFSLNYPTSSSNVPCMHHAQDKLTCKIEYLGDTQKYADNCES